LDTERQDRKLVWQQSQGAQQRYINMDSSHRYTVADLDKQFKQAQHQRVMLISDTAGMGKSTVLTHLSKQIKQMFPAKWVVRIDLANKRVHLMYFKGGK
jgi:2-phosphoglycerate kinase